MPSVGQQQQCKKKKPILEHKRHNVMLASVLAVWRKLRGELQKKGAVQTTAQQRRNVNRMVGELHGRGQVQMHRMIKSRCTGMAERRSKATVFLRTAEGGPTAK